jgi:hypothetical protein
VTRRELARNGAQLAGLWAVAVAQPLFDLMKSGEPFVIAGWRGGDIVVFAVLAMFLVPGLLLAVEAIAGRIRPRLGETAHVLFLAALAAVLALYVIKQTGEWTTEPSLLIALVVAGLAALAFTRLEPVRSFLTLLGAASLLFLLLFLLGSPVRHLVFPDGGADHEGPRPSAPVVLIVFDEFPTLSLLDARGQLDRRSYPTFASLADDAIWFRNATTVADFTTSAVPAILTGRRPDGIVPASASAVPDNLLALLARRGGLHGFEDRLTRMCPGELCELNRPEPLPGRFTGPLGSFGKLALAEWLPSGLYKRLPATDPFEQPVTVAEFERFGTARNVSLHYLHLAMPHAPWNLTPSGKNYRENVIDHDDFVPDPPDDLRAGFGPHAAFVWTKDERRLITMRQRHLAQARFTDRYLSKVLARLRRSGEYDRATVVVTADHGIAFEPGADSRQVGEANAPGVMMVPLFVKPPRSRAGAVSDRFVQSIDVAPTIADAIAIELPWKTEGRSALGPSAPDRRRLEVFAVAEERRLEFEAAPLARRLREEAARQAALFAGSDPDRIYRAGPNRHLLGRRADELPRGAPSALRHELGGSPTLSFEVQPKDNHVPVLVGGRFLGPSAAGTEFVVAVNGRLVGAGRSHGRFAHFEAFLPETAFRAGRNDVKLYAVAGGGRLAEIPPAGAG